MIKLIITSKTLHFIIALLAIVLAVSIGMKYLFEQEQYPKVDSIKPLAEPNYQFNGQGKG